MIPLSAPFFIARDPQAITAELVAKYELATGKTLYPAQIERQLIDLIAYAKTMTHIGIQEAGKQCLVRFANGVMLDYLGELMGVPRLLAAFAKTTLRGSMPAALAINVAIPVGTVISSSDGKVNFATDIAVSIVAGQLSIDVLATCDTAGLAGNDWQIAQINTLISDIGNVAVSFTNITVSAGGWEIETDDRYRTRLIEGLETFAVAGPEGSYRSNAMAAHQSIVDVGIIGPKLAMVGGALVSTNNVPPGVVYVYPLVITGAPDANILTLVNAKLSATSARPLCDFVQVSAPVAVDYAINAQLTLWANADATMTLDASTKAAQALADYLAAGLGRDVVVNDWVTTLKVAGVYDLAIPSLPVNLVLDKSHWARCTGINIVVIGVSNG
jgi:phage-related baseplate assembly protein